MIKRTIVWILACAPLVVSADTAYVTDILRLGLHRAQDTSDRPFDNLVSGTQLEILERVPNFARVRTTDDQEGWVKSAYLVSDKPAQLRVAEVEAEMARLRAELDVAQSERHRAQETAEEIARRASAATDSSEAIQDTLARLKQENERYEQQLEAYRGALPLKWVAAALAVVLIAGFAGGWWWLDASIRRRHGGFRIW